MSPSARNPGPTPSEKAYRELSVLVAEDSFHLARLITGILRSLGIVKVHHAHAHDRAAALHILATQSIDLALVDDLDTQQSGLAIVKALRKAPMHREMPIIFMISQTQVSAIVEARDAGVTEILSKPFSAGQMAARIEAILTKPRPLVESEGFVGPDRRRREKEPGKKRRQSDRSGSETGATEQ